MRITYSEIGQTLEVEDVPELGRAIEEIEPQVEDLVGHHAATWTGPRDLSYACYQSEPEEIDQALDLWVAFLAARGIRAWREGQAPPACFTHPGPRSRLSPLADSDSDD